MNVAKHLRELADRIEFGLVEQASEPMTLGEAANALLALVDDVCSLKADLNRYHGTWRVDWSAHMKVAGANHFVQADTLCGLVDKARHLTQPEKEESFAEVLDSLSDILTPQGGAA